MSTKAVDISKLNFDDRGLIPAIVQSARTNRVLMLAWMNAESLELSIKTGKTVFYSRSRSEIWHKGNESGNFQVIQSIQVDCDNDCVLIEVVEAGPACHTNSESCFDTGEIATDQGHHG
jgi:phosphoribosyl-ATP pyrophosphohydrolase/phosphoribosyl-AMP cyclohydrolase